MADHSRDSSFAGDGGPPDPLEGELESFRPARMSDALADRIGLALAEAPPPSRRLSPGRRLLLVGLAAAACVVALIRLGGDGDTSRPLPGPIAATQPSEPAATVAAAPLPPPSLRAYQRALADSPDALDTLLDAHGPKLLRAPRGGPQEPVSIQSSRTQLSTLNGDTL